MLGHQGVSIMARFFFVDKQEGVDSIVNEHFISMYFCWDCKAPQDYINSIVYPGWVNGPEECFTCGKSFDGNTSARNVIISLDGNNINRDGKII